MADSILDHLSAANGWIFRITHRENVRSMLRHGLLCSDLRSTEDPDFVTIGSADLIAKRSSHAVPIPPRAVVESAVKLRVLCRPGWYFR